MGNNQCCEVMHDNKTQQIVIDSTNKPKPRPNSTPKQNPQKNDQKTNQKLIEKNTSYAQINVQKKNQTVSNIQTKQKNQFKQQQQVKYKNFDHDNQLSPQIMQNNLSQQKKQNNSLQNQKDLRRSIKQVQQQNNQYQQPPISQRRSSKVIFQPVQDTKGLVVQSPQLLPKVRQTYLNLGSIQSIQKNNKQIHKPHKFLQNNYIYEGQWLNHKPHGYGKLYLPDGSFFEGTFKNGHTQGYGRMIYPDGGYFQGEISQDKAQGKGHYKSKTLEYKGMFSGNQFHGEGQQKCSDGTSFKGLYKNGRKQQGILKWGKNQYEGYLNDKCQFQKKGKLMTIQGVYSGQFSKGLKHGYGQYKRKGTLYKGNYVQGEKCGFGTFYNANGTIAYKGLWKNNLPNGLGCVYVNGVPKPDRQWVDGIAKQEIQRTMGSSTM